MTDNAVAAIAAAAEESAKPINCIRFQEHDTKPVVTVTMVLAGVPQAWIEYDAAQLEDLVSVAADYRERLLRKHGK